MSGIVRLPSPRKRTYHGRPFGTIVGLYTRGLGNARGGTSREGETRADGRSQLMGDGGEEGHGKRERGARFSMTINCIVNPALLGLLSNRDHALANLDAILGQVLGSQATRLGRTSGPVRDSVVKQRVDRRDRAIENRQGMSGASATESRPCLSWFTVCQSSVRTPPRGGKVFGLNAR